MGGTGDSVDKSKQFQQLSRIDLCWKITRSLYNMQQFQRVTPKGGSIMWGTAPSGGLPGEASTLSRSSLENYAQGRVGVADIDPPFAIE